MFRGGRLFFLILLSLAFFGGCDLTKLLGSEEDDEEYTGSLIEEFVFKTENNPSLQASVNAFIDQDAQIITARLPDALVNSDSPLRAKATLSAGATIDPDPDVARGYQKDVYFTVTAESGSQRTYVVQSELATSAGDAAIVSFKLSASHTENTELTEDVFGVVSGSDIYVYLPYSALSGGALFLQPEVVVGNGGDYMPKGPQNFKSSISYTAVSQTGETALYNINVLVDPGSF